MKTEFRQKMTEYSVKHYKLVTVVMVAFTLFLGAMIPLIKIDTDPENMLSKDEAVRIFHNKTKKEFSLNDIVVVGIVNDKDPNGVFNPSSLVRIYELTEFAKSLRWPDEKNPNEEIGVVDVDILAPSTVDHIGQGEPGEVKFEWLMQKPPATSTEALAIRDKAMSNPLLKGTVVSENGKAICLYLPITDKDLSYKVYRRLKEKIATFSGDERYHITGLPVAEDTFGVEMFIQMAVSAPLAMVVIFILMLLFFRKLVLVISPMIVAIVSVVSTMGLLIGLGYPVHIMSSMIPIFLMPISVVDSVHILSQFFDRYSPQKGRRDTIIEVMGSLFTPMLYTSLTSAAGFASLALTPIPPVQVFGIFVAVGVMIAWIFTITFIPAYVMMISDKTLENFGRAAQHGDKKTWLTTLLLRSAGRFTYVGAKLILIVMLVITAVAIYGISQIQINDNPVKWFAKRHPIRVADTELNKHFGGTYMAYLVLSGVEEKGISNQYIKGLSERLAKKRGELVESFPDADAIVAEAEKIVSEQAASAKSKDELLDKVSSFVSNKVDTADENDVDVWYEVADFFDLEKERLKIFKQPETLRYIERLQEYLAGIGAVGKSNSVADVVKKVYQELTDGKAESYVIPDSEGAVAQCLIQFQSSHNPEDLWHLVTYDYMNANIWLQLTGGDNKDMQEVIEAVDNFFRTNPPPVPMKYDWAGLTYINVVWQDKMVWGMLQSFLGSFIVVFVMMAILFRSILWGLICMLPLTITIGVIYGVVGLSGKDYDMPVAVLSALTLGMAVDFAIHFLERAREEYRQSKSWEAASLEMFGEPARAISRNVIVIAIGFLPLLAAPLVPYKTVGIFVCAIMAASGAVTLLVQPAIIRLLEKKLFKSIAEPMRPSCNCAFCVIISTATVILVAVNVHQFAVVKWNVLVWVSIIAIPLMAMVCGITSRRAACKRVEGNSKEKEQ